MKHLKTIMSVMAILAAVSCAKTTVVSNGQVTFGISSDQMVIDKTKSNVSDYTSLPVSGDFTMSIKDAENTQIWTGKVSEWNAETQLKAGAYTVTATYGAVEDEGFDKPYFTGDASFTVTGGQTATVSIPVTLGNTIVKISCTDDFMNYYKDYNFRFTRDGMDIVTFAKGDDRGAFIDGYKFTLEGTLTSETKTHTFSKEYAGLDAATAYTFVFDASNVGSTSITISFNDKVETVDLGDYELND